MREETICRETCRQKDVKCPFYRQDDGKGCLACEGVVEGSTMEWKFENQQDLKQQMEIFCCDYYKNCEVYRMLREAKY